MNIEYTFTGAGRRKRESERQGRQMNGMVGPITISKTNNNLVDMVKINLMKLLGNDGVDTYYYYDVSCSVMFCWVRVQARVAGEHDGARLQGEHQVDPR